MTTSCRKRAACLVGLALLTACSSKTSPGSSSSGSVSQSIGPSGGTLTAPDGTSVQIPAGALATATTLTITPSPSLPPPDGGVLVGTPYDFGPEGTQFASPVTLTLAFTPSKLLAGTSSSDIDIFTAPAGSTAYTGLATTVVDATHVSAQVSHFTGFITAEFVCVPGCQAGETCCLGSCGSSFFSVLNCGACGVKCDGAIPGCCGSHYAGYPPSCVDLSRQNGNCGACGYSCPSGTFCVDGVCQSLNGTGGGSSGSISEGGSSSSSSGSSSNCALGGDSCRSSADCCTIAAPACVNSVCQACVPSGGACDNSADCCLINGAPATCNGTCQPGPTSSSSSGGSISEGSTSNSGSGGSSSSGGSISEGSSSSSSSGGSTGACLLLGAACPGANATCCAPADFCGGNGICCALAESPCDSSDECCPINGAPAVCNAGACQAPGFDAGSCQPLGPNNCPGGANAQIACGYDSSCTCCGPGYCDQGNNACCSPTNSPCSSSADCCTIGGLPGVCVSGLCQQAPPPEQGCAPLGTEGSPQGEGNNCCVGSPANGTSGICCLSAGDSCDQTSDCCVFTGSAQLICDCGICTTESCSPSGQCCNTNSDCCSGSCIGELCQ